jgi:hypothetical protein
MSVTETIQLVAPYVEQDEGPLLLSSMFSVPPDGIHNKDKVEFHIRRTSREIAYPQRDATTGYRMNGLKGFDIKQIKPTTYKEGVSASADEVMSGRSFNRTPYENPAFMARVQEVVAPTITEIIEMIKRAIEIQASQILTTGEVTLTDGTGTVYSEDFEVLSTHFPNASVAWTTAGSAVPFTDIANLCDVIERDGKSRVRRAICNSSCFDEMKATTQFKNGASKDYTGEIYRLDETSEPVHPRLNNGAIFVGVLKIRGARKIDLYIYDEWHENASGTKTEYIGDTKFLLEASPRLDATFGAINKFGIDTEAAAVLRRVGRATSRSGLVDLSYNMWFSPDREVFNFGVGTRPALCPITRDRFGCITTKGF